MPNFEIKKGYDGNWFMVFAYMWDAELAWDHFEWSKLGYRIASFGEYDNAIQLTK